MAGEGRHYCDLMGQFEATASSGWSDLSLLYLTVMTFSLGAQPFS